MIFSLSPFSVAKNWNECANVSCEYARVSVGREALSCKLLLAHPGGPVEASNTIPRGIPSDQQLLQTSSSQVINPASELFKTPVSIPISLSTDDGSLCKRRVRPMDRFCFTGKFCKFTPKILSELEATFIACSGKLPLRRELRILGQKLGIPQSQIRRWFIEHETLKLAPTQSNHTTNDQLANLEKRLERMEQKINAIEQKVNVQESTLLKTLQSIFSFPLNWSQDFSYG